MVKFTELNIIGFEFVNVSYASYHLKIICKDLIISKIKI